MTSNICNVFVVFEIGRRRLFPIDSRSKTLTIIEIHILIVCRPGFGRRRIFPIEY